VLVVLALKIIVAVVAVLVVSAAALRWRKLRRDDLRTRDSVLERRLVAPPPSPYQPSKGFRLLDDAGAELTRPTPERPRLEPERSYVFSESGAPDDQPLSLGRHDTRWALERSMHRTSVPRGASRALVVLALVALVAVGAVGYTMRHRASAHPTTTTTSTTSTTVASTTTTWPNVFVPVSSTPTSATYAVPSTKYDVTVRAVAGPVWAVYRMGPQRTLEFQGTVAVGTSKTLPMTGVAEITLGSPRNASVEVNGSPVTLPSPVGSPLVLTFSAPTTG
jgi:hypothetical protein